MALRWKSNGDKKRGVPVEVGGEPGYAIRNSRFASPIESLWDGISTLPGLFELACKQYSNKRLLGSRELISRETEVSSDGRSFEKLHLGDYKWLSYGEAFVDVCNFSSGLVKLGLKKIDRVAIFADTRPEWIVALQVFYRISETHVIAVSNICFDVFSFFLLPYFIQGCFRRSITVVTIYSSLGEEALCHSLNEVLPHFSNHGAFFPPFFIIYFYFTTL